MKTCAAISIAISIWATALWAEPACRDISFEDGSFTACTADPGTADIRLFLRDDAGQILGSFGAIDDQLTDGKLLFATNAGMYHQDRRPVGLYVENGREQTRIVTREGPGNFGLLPNGVLCLTPGRAQVIESRAFKATKKSCTHATQSGPMLVIDGALHPRFLKNATSRFIRNGVGITEDGQMIIAISNGPVTFHHFARLFRDVLGTPNALFLDGSISRLHAPELGRSDFGLPLGPMLGVVLPDQDR